MTAEHEKNTEIDLMVQVRTGDTEALRRLYELYKQELLAFFYRLERDRHRAEDALQEVFLRLWAARERYRPTASFRTFIYTIARNLWLNQNEKRKNSPVKERLDRYEVGLLKSGDNGAAGRSSRTGRSPATPLEELETKETLQRLLDAVDRLPRDRKLAFVMAHYQGMKYAEIAQVTGVPLGTVKSRIANAVAAIRQQLTQKNRTRV